jgi:hypothetical protein
VRQQEHALAVFRAVTPGRRETVIPVYTVLVNADADADALRRGVAEVVAGTGADRCAVEVFCPFQRLSVFQVRLYGGSTGLWKTGRRPPADSPAPVAPTPADSLAEASAPTPDAPAPAQTTKWFPTT